VSKRHQSKQEYLNYILWRYKEMKLSNKKKIFRILKKLAGIGHGPSDGSDNYNKHAVMDAFNKKFEYRRPRTIIA